MTILSLVLPIISQPDKTEDPKINTAFTAIQSWANGQIDSSNIKPASLVGASIKPESLGGNTLLKGVGGAISGETIAATYTARAEVAINAKIKSPSSTRPVWANIDVQLIPQSGFGTIATIFIGGVEGPELYVPENVANGVGLRLATTILLAANEEWELKNVAAAGAKASSLHVAYRVM